MLRLTITDYWKEIEALDFTAAIKDTLKGLVNAHLNHAIPPHATPAELDAMRKSGPAEILLTRPERCGGHEEFLVVMHFQPYNRMEHREFLYLAKGYPNGFNQPLALT